MEPTTNNHDVQLKGEFPLYFYLKEKNGTGSRYKLMEEVKTLHQLKARIKSEYTKEIVQKLDTNSPVRLATKSFGIVELYVKTSLITYINAPEPADA